MSIFEKFLDIEQKYNVRLHEGENFKQAFYNGRMMDSDKCIIDKIELVLHHYPDNKNLVYLLMNQMKRLKFHFVMP